MSGGCNSCKYLDPNGKKPGRSGGALFQCKLTGKFMNAAKDSCDNYDLDQGRSSFEVNDIYKESYNYSDLKNTNGCNSCAYLDPKSKKPGKNSGAYYFCENRKNYVDATSDACENYKDGHRDSLENNKIYQDSKNYSDSSGSNTSHLFILILLVLFIIIYYLFLS